MNLCVQVSGLQATLRNLEGSSRESGSMELSKSDRRLMFASGVGPTQSSVRQAREVNTMPRQPNPQNMDVTVQPQPRHPDVSFFHFTMLTKHWWRTRPSPNFLQMRMRYKVWCHRAVFTANVLQEFITSPLMRSFHCEFVTSTFWYEPGFITTWEYFKAY